MINKDELLFCVDENNNPVRPVPRHQAHADGIWHRATDIIILNSKREILCNQRSLLKDFGPGEWDFAFGGHVLAGEDSLTNALNETKEESGLTLSASDLKFLQISKYVSADGRRRHFGYVYLCHWDGSLTDLKLEDDEIIDAQWFNLSEAIAGIENRKNRQWVDRPDILEILKTLV